MTLAEYANSRENVVLFWAGVGCPMGDYDLIGHPAFDFAECRELLDLEGEVDAEGDWNWNGQSNPTDWLGNSITKLQAYTSADRWDAIVEEYENS